MRLQRLDSLALALACCLPAQTTRAQNNTDPCKLSFARHDVALKLTLKGGQTVYHEGEIISLELAFTTSTKNRYVSINEEYFCLSPEGYDPLQEYYQSGLFNAKVGGAISIMSAPPPTLSDVPYIVSKELNELKSMPPGSYSLHVVNPTVSAISNEVTFQVVPATPEWQAEQLARALAWLDVNPTEHTQGEDKHAVRVLRFLGSEASTRELARRFWCHDQPPSPIPNPSYPLGNTSERIQDWWDFKAGLISSPYRAVAIQELTAAIDDHQHPATRAMVGTLAFLEIQSMREYPRFLPYDRSHPDEWEKQSQAKGAAYNVLLAKILKRAQ